MLTCLSLTTYHLHFDHVILLLKGTKLTVYGIKSKLLCMAFQVLEATFPIFLPYSPLFFFFFFGHAAKLTGPYFSDQGSNP